jgi:hypothetical protein
MTRIVDQIGSGADPADRYGEMPAAAPSTGRCPTWLHSYGVHLVGLTRFFAVLAVVIVALSATPEANAETPLGPAQYVPCPVPTDDPAMYGGANAAFRCRTAVTDPDGLVVILREGWSATAGKGPFGVQHASIDRGVGEDMIARVVSSVRPVPGEQRRLHYIAELGEVSVRVMVDRAPSRQAPDTRPFGLITAFCRSTLDVEPQRCPDWVNELGASARAADAVLR